MQLQTLISELDNKLELLEKRKSELLSELNESALGVIISEYVRCGKDNCKCASGDLHGPYFYHYYWDRNKVKKRYICPVHKPNEILHELETKIKNRKKNEKLQNEISRINQILIEINSAKTDFKSKVSQILKK